MTTFFPFTPSSLSAPSFSPTLDGQVCNVIVTWNLFGQRYYVNCYDQNNNRLFTVPLIETPPSIALASLSWSTASLSIQGVTVLPHGLPLGQVVNLIIEDASPDGYNGAQQVAVTGPNTFQFPATSDPGQIVTAGSATFPINLCYGYFSSVMIFRSGQFEISP